MNKVMVPLRAFNTANQVLKEGGKRYGIEGVSIDVGPVAFATDGRAILAVAWEGQGPKEPLLISAVELQHVKKLALLENKRVQEIDVAGAKPITDAVFPDVRRCVPSYADSECTVAVMDAKRLGNLLLNMAKCMGEVVPIVMLKVPHDATRPILAFGGPAGEAQTVLGVLMPYGPQEFKPLPQIKAIMDGGEKPCKISPKGESHA